MGSFIELNDTLQITSEQGFPKELNFEEHKNNPINLDSIKDKVYKFKDKPSIRLYQAPPVRNFLVQNIDGKWLYWGLIHMLEVTHDYVNKTTSGKFKIIHINSLEEMKTSFDVIDRNPNTNFLS